jgi:hypothetical protein
MAAFSEEKRIMRPDILYKPLPKERKNFEAAPASFPALIRSSLMLTKKEGARYEECKNIRAFYIPRIYMFFPRICFRS